MTTRVDLDEENAVSGFVPIFETGPTGAAEDAAASLISKTAAQAEHIQIAGATGTSSLVDRVSPIQPISIDTTELENELNQLKEIDSRLKEANPPAPHVFKFPNLALESLKVGLLQEKFTNGKLKGHIAEAEEEQKTIKDLLDLSAELTTHGEDSKEISPKIKEMLTQLKERGIDLWKGEGAKISDLKSLTNAQVDRLRANLQNRFATKIQVLIQLMSTIMEALKDIIRNNTKLINAANRLPGR